MSTYLISDIHGHYDRFMDMLSLIKFSIDDKMIVIGDAIDRGPDGVKVLQHIIDTPNIHFMIGNHELMMLESDILDEHGWNESVVEENRKLWIENNGGYHTMKALWDLPDHGASIIHYVENACKTSRSLQAFTKLDDGRVYALCHGWPVASSKYTDANAYVRDSVWTRPTRTAAPIRPEKYPNATLVIGHTPVNFLYTTNELFQMKDYYRILHAPHFIDIDCGCGHRGAKVRLACLCLNNMEEFYV